MEIWLQIQSMAVGAIVALLVVSYRKFTRASKRLDESANEFAKTTTGIHKVHNELAEKVMTMEEKVNSHDFQLKANVSKMGINPFTTTSRPGAKK